MVVVAAVDGVDVESLADAPVVQPATSTHIRTAVRSDGIVLQPATSDLRLHAMKRLACLVFGITLVAGCNVGAGSETTATLPPIGSASNTAAPTTVTTVTTLATLVPATELPIAATSTIPLPAGVCVFSAPSATADVTFEVGTRLYSVNPGS